MTAGNSLDLKGGKKMYKQGNSKDKASTRHRQKLFLVMLHKFGLHLRLLLSADFKKPSVARAKDL